MKYNHALFLNPYRESAARSIMNLFPPTGLEYVATSAKGLVGKVTLFDLRYETTLAEPQNLIDFIKKNIDIVCVGIGWDRQFDDICSLLNMIPKDIKLVVGGYKATEQVDELFKRCPNIDIIARGEAEETIKEILQEKPPESILGISYRKNDRIIHNANRALPEVKSVAWPDRKLRNNNYHMSLNGVNVMNLTFDTVLSARGCPFNCKFCTFNLNPLGQKRTYAERSVESVMDEIESISAKMILFSDDNFATNIKRAERICDLLIEKKIKKRFTAQVRIDIAKHPRLLEKMVKAGFKVLLMGIESPHDWILEQLNKGFDSKKAREYFKILTKYPIFYHGYFIYGNLGETEEEMLYIPKFAQEVGLDSIACSKLRIDKFSPLKEVAQRTPGYHVTDRGECYSDMYSHASLKKIGRKMKFTFYNVPGIMKVVKKLFVARILTLKEIFSFILVSPLLLIKLITREIEKNRLGDSVKRMFFKNT